MAEEVDVDLIKVDPPFEIWNAQVQLRFVKRDGKFILQQAWVHSIVQGAMLFPTKTEWRDVPLVEE